MRRLGCRRPTSEAFRQAVLNYEMHGTGARPMISLRIKSLSRYMPIMDFESVAAIAFYRSWPHWRASDHGRDSLAARSASCSWLDQRIHAYLSERLPDGKVIPVFI